VKLREKDIDAVIAADGRVATGGAAPAAPKRRRLRLIGLGVTVAVLAAAVAAWASGDGDGGQAGDGSASRAASTATVTRQDLVSRTDVDGTLGYAGERSVVNHKQGTITALPGEGAVIERGMPLYWIENQPVALFYGDLPAWRSFQIGMSDGPDVRQLEQNLVALGHATEEELSVDERFTWATAVAIQRWQKAIGLEETGRVDVGDVAFLPDALRVSSVKGEKGSSAPPGVPILTGTSTTRVVNVDLEATKQSLVKVGDTVEVKLPGGRTTTGSIASVGSVARSKGQGESTKQVISVTVTLDDPKATGTVDQAPVKVGITADSRKGVLAVPVNALLALREGGYGVRVMEGDGSRLIPVETGLFARGMVEVSGDGLREGQLVEVPAS
jgi:hypothetical protein